MTLNIEKKPWIESNSQETKGTKNEHGQKLGWHQNDDTTKKQLTKLSQKQDGIPMIKTYKEPKLNINRTLDDILVMGKESNKRISLDKNQDDISSMGN